MAVLNFPNNPLNGDQYKENGVTYTYVGTFPNGFWQADNRNVSPAPDPNPTFAGTVTYSSLTGANTTLATLSATGVLGRVDVTSATAPYALKAGDTFSGDVNFVDGAFLGLGINTPQRVLDIAGNAPQIGVFANTGDPAFRMSDGSHEIALTSENNTLGIYSGTYTGDPEVVVDASGQIGVGILNPAAKVEIKDDSGLALTKGDSGRRYTLEPLTNLTIKETVGNKTLTEITPDGELKLINDITINNSDKAGQQIKLSNDSTTKSVLSLANDSQSAEVKYENAKLQLANESNLGVSVDALGNVGIGKEVPTADLDVSGTSKFSGAMEVMDGKFRLDYTQNTAGDTVAVLGTIGDEALTLQTASKDRLNISNNGNLEAISEELSPTFVFRNSAEVAERAGGGFRVVSNSDAALRQSLLVLDANGGDLSGSSNFTLSLTGDRNVDFNNGNGAIQSFSFGGTEAGRFTSNGDLLLGTSLAADAKVVIYGSNAGTQYQNAATANGPGEGFFVGLNAQHAIINNTNGAGSIQFSTGNILRGLFTSAGRFLVGNSVATSALISVGDVSRSETDLEVRTSDTGIGSISFREATANGVKGSIDYDHVNNRLQLGTNNTPRLSIESDGQFTIASGNSTGMILGSTKVASSTDNFLTAISSVTGLRGVGGITNLRIATNGNIENVNNSYGALSDQKLKKNITIANSQWEDIKQIQLKNFEFKSSVGVTGRQLGVIAQDLQEISPGLVEAKADTITLDSPVFDELGEPVLDGNGNQVMETITQETGTETLSVKYSVLYLKAVGALQEAMTRIEELEAKVAALES